MGAATLFCVALTGAVLTRTEDYSNYGGGGGGGFMGESASQAQGASAKKN